MRKLFTMAIVASLGMMARATDYTDQLLVVVNGVGSQQEATISVTEHDGLYDLNLKNFTLMSDDAAMPVGNVELKDITPEPAGDAIFLRADRNITVTSGDQPGVDLWMGPSLGELPVQVTAVLRGQQLDALIDLDLMALMKQMVSVRFGKSLVSGTGYHIPNGDFKAWHTSSGNYVEPNAWHSFESASGTLASLAGHHIEKSGNGRGGSACARVFSTSIFGIVANGTMTTGRLNAGSMSAADPANHAYMDMSLTDVDGNGDPFYVAVGSRPDSLVVWLQFKQGTANADHPYATVSAVITDGTRYQDPEDKTYTNVVARANDNKIAVTDGQWRRISVPFVYTGNPIEPKAVMVTISTNADAGQGSNNDEVLVDDLTLVYSSRLASLQVEGFDPQTLSYEVDGRVTSPDDLVPQAESKSAYVLRSTEELENGLLTTIKVFSADLRSATVYTVRHDGMSSGIARLDNVSAHPAAVGRYNLNGQKLSSSSLSRQTVIEKREDGSVVKVLR